MTAAMYGVDVALLQVKISEGALYPTVDVQGNVQQRWDVSADHVRDSGRSRRSGR